MTHVDQRAVHPSHKLPNDPAELGSAGEISTIAATSCVARRVVQREGNAGLLDRVLRSPNGAIAELEGIINGGAASTEKGFAMELLARMSGVDAIPILMNIATTGGRHSSLDTRVALLALARVPSDKAVESLESLEAVAAGAGWNLFTQRAAVEALVSSPQVSALSALQRIAESQNLPPYVNDIAQKFMSGILHFEPGVGEPRDNKMW